MDPKMLTSELATKLEAFHDAIRQPSPNTDELIEVLKGLSATARNSLQAIRQARAAQSAGLFQEEGYALLAPTVWMEGVSCDVLARQAPDGYRSYLIKANLAVGGGSQKVVIGSCERAPNNGELFDILVAAGLLDDESSSLTGDEWAINVHGGNPFDSNFPHEALRDCAVDELILEGGLDAVDRLVLFRIDASGEQDEESYPDPKAWAQGRNLPIADTPSIHERGEVQR